MKTILLIVSFLIIIFTFFIFYIGIYDEIYQKIEKNKFWFTDGSFSISLVFLLLSIFCLIYIFKNLSNKMKKLDLEEYCYSIEALKMELVKHNKHYKDYQN